jgi:hypothetical protein
MQALKKALLVRERTARKPHEDVLIVRERRTKIARFWKRLMSGRLARPRKPAIWPTPQHLVKGDSAPNDRR